MKYKCTGCGLDLGDGRGQPIIDGLPVCLTCAGAIRKCRGMVCPTKFGEWTTIANDLPGAREIVILYVKHGTKLTSGRYFEGRFYESGDGYPFKASEVLAWMPMPDAPAAFLLPSLTPGEPLPRA